MSRGSHDGVRLERVLHGFSQVLGAARARGRLDLVTVPDGADAYEKDAANSGRCSVDGPELKRRFFRRIERAL